MGEAFLDEILSGSADETPLSRVKMTLPAFSKGLAKMYIKDGLFAVHYDRSHKSGEFKPGTKFLGKDGAVFMEIVAAARKEIGADVGSKGLFVAVSGAATCRRCAGNLRDYYQPTATALYKVDGTLWDKENCKAYKEKPTDLKPEKTDCIPGAQRPKTGEGSDWIERCKLPPLEE